MSTCSSVSKNKKRERSPSAHSSTSSKTSSRTSSSSSSSDEEEEQREAFEREFERPVEDEAYRRSSIYRAAKPNVVLCFRCGEMGHNAEQCLRFKVKLCTYFMDGWCERDDARVPCAYAHGEAELRRPWVKKCVRVWSELRGDACIGGCGKYGHTYSDCPLNRDVNE